MGGGFPGDVAVVALGKAGSREMTARSDLDLMTLYAADPVAMSSDKGWGAETFYARFTQRLITALASPTAEGELYPVDLRLRPSGSAGPVAVSLGALQRYYDQDAETWEAMAMTRARVVWASSPAFARRARGAIEAVLRRPRDPAAAARDALDMRRLMLKERPPAHLWDLKLEKGGLVDIEFTAQTLQIVHAAAGGPLRVNTGEALEALGTAGVLDAASLGALNAAFTLQQDLSQVLKVALNDDADPRGEPRRFQAILAKTGGVRTFAALQTLLQRRRAAAHGAFISILSRLGAAGMSQSPR
jgi:glutamate-ammonia-ligase adenylyltransferase